MRSVAAQAGLFARPRKTAQDCSNPPPTNEYDHLMSLSSTAQPAHETIRGVKFAMLDRTTRVAVLVAHAALQSIEWSPPGSGDYLARFQRNRQRLENIASKKHGRSQMEKNGSILIENYDLQIL